MFLFAASDGEGELAASHASLQRIIGTAGKKHGKIYPPSKAESDIRREGSDVSVAIAKRYGASSESLPSNFISVKKKTHTATDEKINTSVETPLSCTDEKP